MKELKNSNQCYKTVLDYWDYFGKGKSPFYNVNTVSYISAGNACISKTVKFRYLKDEVHLKLLKSQSEFLHYIEISEC